MSGNRSMPAHFTSYKDRRQSFCIDNDLIDADDEYSMASESYYKFYDFLKDEASGNGLIILKIGEDIMIGSYIINKLGHLELANELKQSLIKENIDLLDQDDSDFVNDLLKLSETQLYLEHCVTYGKNIALTK
jgi:hypothetical protein